MTDRILTAVFGTLAALLLLALGVQMNRDSGELPQPEGAEVGGEEEAAEVGGEEEAAPQGDLHLLPEGEHRDLVIATCTTCHGAAPVASQRLPRGGWDQTITWMQKEQALWDLTGDQRGFVLDYLEAHFGPRAQAPELANSPWAQPLYEPNPLW